MREKYLLYLTDLTPPREGLSQRRRNLTINVVQCITGLEILSDSAFKRTSVEIEYDGSGVGNLVGIADGCSVGFSVGILLKRSPQASINDLLFYVPRHTLNPSTLRGHP